MTLFVTGALLLVLPAFAAAASLPTTSAHTAPAADYIGWGYVKDDTGAASVASWKWSAAGWQATNFAPGSYAWVYPWGTGWNWAWRDSAWFAVRSENLATWSCSTANLGDVFPKVLRSEVNVLKFAAANSPVLGKAAYDDRVQLSCGNGFKDAQNGPTTYALVKVTDYADCPIFNFECVLNPTVRSRISGYVDVTNLSEHPTVPPNNGGLGIFPGA